MERGTDRVLKASHSEVEMKGIRSESKCEDQRSVHTASEEEKRKHRGSSSMSAEIREEEKTGTDIEKRGSGNGGISWSTTVSCGPTHNLLKMSSAQHVRRSARLTGRAMLSRVNSSTTLWVPCRGVRIGKSRHSMASHGGQERQQRKKR